MAGKPLRTVPKRLVNLHIETDLYKCIHTLFYGRGNFKSVSQLIEAAIFLVRAEYLQEGENVIYRLKDVRAYTYQALDCLDAWPATRLVHVSFDLDALKTLDLLCSRYPVVFSNRDMAASLILRYVAGQATDEEGCWRMSHRMRDALGSFYAQ